MSLKKDLRSHLEHLLQDTISKETEIRNSLDALEGFNARSANYVIQLTSLWADYGETTTITGHKGYLKDAIKKAEDRFKQVNKRADVQANWYVTIEIGENKYPIPKKYWEKYREKKY